jgi:hypothetical protein
MPEPSLTKRPQFHNTKVKQKGYREADEGRVGLRIFATEEKLEQARYICSRFAALPSPRVPQTLPVKW